MKEALEINKQKVAWNICAPTEDQLEQREKDSDARRLKDTGRAVIDQPVVPILEVTDQYVLDDCNERKEEEEQMKTKLVFLDLFLIKPS